MDKPERQQAKDRLGGLPVAQQRAGTRRLGAVGPSRGTASTRMAPGWAPRA
jgi:hypothetical protein